MPSTAHRPRTREAAGAIAAGTIAAGTTAVGAITAALRSAAAGLFCLGGCTFCLRGCALCFSGCALCFSGCALCFSGCALCLSGCALYFSGCALCLSGCALCFSGCAGQPAAVAPPQIDAPAAARRLLAALDEDGDGQLSPAEAAGSPGIEKMYARYDTDGDHRLSEDEIAARFRTWSADGAGVMKVGCLVTLDGRRLAGAKVVFEPERCFGDALISAGGATGTQGQCNISVDPAAWPESLARVRGVQPGLYRVRITHPETEIPARYNTATTLGQEVSAEAIGPEGIHFALQTR